MQALLHILPAGTRWCFHKGCEHRSQNVMLTIDLVSERAWQRCWDHECVITAPSGGGHLKAKYALGRPPARAVPSLVQLVNFEANRGCLNDMVLGVAVAGGGGDSDHIGSPPGQSALLRLG